MAQVSPPLAVINMATQKGKESYSRHPLAGRLRVISILVQSTCSTCLKTSDMTCQPLFPSPTNDI